MLKVVVEMVLPKIKDCADLETKILFEKNLFVYIIQTAKPTNIRLTSLLHP
jgi:hypothetical protein